MLIKKVQELARARANYQIADGVKRQALETFLASPEYKELLATSESAKGAMGEAEAMVRELAAAKFEQDGEKQGVGYSIRVGEVIEITDVNAAREWCLTNFTPALLLDVKEFTAAAKRKVTPPGLVSTSEKVTVAIKTDLGEFLDER